MIDEATRIASKRAGNKACYAASKPTQDHVLLRLPRGGARPLDDARAATGLSRSAFAALYLSPLLAALSPTLPAIDVACRDRGQSLSRFMELAIAAALEHGVAAAPTASAALEFDKLFSSGSP